MAKAIILLGTLKTHAQSNTQVLSEFFRARAMAKGLECEIVKLVDFKINPGTDEKEGDDDEWPTIYEKIKAAEVLVMATPVWWGNHSSEIQRAIERLDIVHDEILEGKVSKLDGKAGGVIVTGDGDGAEHIIGNMANFFNAMGLTFPPYASLTVLWGGHDKKGKTSREELLAKYEKEYASTADTMAERLLAAL
jgi:multimeric flavodoxin WrbA